MKKIYETATVHGMCGGVFSALQRVEKLLQDNPGERVYILHELVHNQLVSAELAAAGACFIDDPGELPPGAVGVIGAHGVSRRVEMEMRRRSDRITDTTCPLVKKLHKFAASVPPEGVLIILGKAEHPEVQGIAGNSGSGEIYIIPAPEAAANLPVQGKKLYCLSQTTLDFQLAQRCEKQLSERFPGIVCCPGVCDASRQRQQAVRELAARCDLFLVVGSRHSSNACRLREIAAEYCPASFLIENAEMIPAEALLRSCRVGLTSGASTPEKLVSLVAEKLRAAGFAAG